MPDAGVGQAGHVDGLGDVFGDVVGDGGQVEGAPGGHERVTLDGAGVSLRAEPEPDQPAGWASGEGDGAGGLDDGLSQQRGRVSGWGWLVVLAVGVQADDGVEVDDAAYLVFGDLRIPLRGTRLRRAVDPGASAAPAGLTARARPQARPNRRATNLRSERGTYQ